MANKVIKLERYWLNPSVFECKGEEDNIKTSTLKYYFTVTSNGETFEKSGSKEVELDCSNVTRVEKRKGEANVIMRDGSDEVISTLEFQYTCMPPRTKCDKSTSLSSSLVYYDVDKVTCSGAVVNYSVDYYITTVDENCKIEQTFGRYYPEEPWVIEPCTGDDCCKTHNVMKPITIEVDGMTAKAMLAREMIADKEKKCNPGCKCEGVSSETYCVDSSSVKVYYPVYDEKGNREWKLPENGEVMKVPKEGGVVMVSFKYYKYIDVVECDNSKHGTSMSGIYEEIIDIPPCICEGDDKCPGTLICEIEFKKPNREGCNILECIVEQETC